MRHVPIAVALAALALGPGCGGSAMDDGARGAGSYAYPTGSGNAGPEAGDGEKDGADGSRTEPVPYVPETEVDVALETPQSGDRYVFVVSTGLDAVVRIDAITLGVDLVEVGGDPTVMRTLPGEDALVVVNSGTRDFSLVRAADDPEKSPDVLTIDSPAAVNRLEVSPDGGFAVAWFDPDADVEAGGDGDLQEVVVLNLQPGSEAAHPVGVGFHTLAVTFATEGAARAFVVTESGLSVIALADVKGAGFVPAMPVSGNPMDPWFDREVLVTPDGKKAVVRRGGERQIRVLDLVTKDAVDLDVQAAATDLDLAPGGKEAIVVVRERSAVVRLDLEEAAIVETIVLMDEQGNDYPAGLANLAPDGKKAVVYSTLDGHEWVGVLDLASKHLDVFATRKGVKSVLSAPDGKTALVLHTKAAGNPDPADLEAFIDRSHAYSILSLEAAFIKLQLVDSPPGEIAMTPDGAKAYVLVPDVTGGLGHMVDDVDMRTFLVKARAMGSPPKHAVYVPAADRMAVSQDHPVGRITFIDTATGESETVTGFELNGMVR